MAWQKFVPDNPMELAEKQGGEIGVASKVGQGATFSFYIKAKRAMSHQINVASSTHCPRPSLSRKTWIQPTETL